MSLFISNLAFTDPEYGSAIRLGVLSGSASMSVIGFLVLRFCPTTTGKQTA